MGEERDEVSTDDGVKREGFAGDGVRRETKSRCRPLL